MAMTIRAGAAWLAEQLGDSGNTEDVTITRKGVTGPTVKAEPSRMGSDMFSSDTVQYRNDSMVFRLIVSDYQVEQDVLTLPETGDIIAWDGGRYEVQSLEGQGPYELLAGEVQIRVHTAKVS